jgi:hypothetical protein
VRTIPCSSFKSYTKDLSLPIFELVFRRRLAWCCKPEQEPSPCYGLGQPRRVAYASSFSHLGKLPIAAFQPGFWLRGVQPSSYTW